MSGMASAVRPPRPELCCLCTQGPLTFVCILRVAVAPPFLASRGEPRQRWKARVLALRSRVQLALNRYDDAAESGAHAVRLCPWLPAAWDAVAEAALGAQDSRTARMALRELIYLQPDRMPGLPLAVENTRRRQRLMLEQMERGEVKIGPSRLSGLNPVIPYMLSEAPPPIAISTAPADDVRGGAPAPETDGATSSGGDPLRTQMDAIFVDSYGVGEEF
jgi:hypothetical protein